MVLKNISGMFWKLKWCLKNISDIFWKLKWCLKYSSDDLKTELAVIINQLKCTTIWSIHESDFCSDSAWISRWLQMVNCWHRILISERRRDIASLGWNGGILRQSRRESMESCLLLNVTWTLVHVRMSCTAPWHHLRRSNAC